MAIKNHPIELIFFSGGNKRLRKKILTLAIKLFPEEQISVYTTLESFSSDLRRPGYSHKIIMILTSTQKDLFNVLSLKKLLNDRYIILILPDTAKETITQAHKLYPRYTSNIQGNFEDVSLVLEKMIGNFQQKINGEKNGTNSRYY
ncbi:MAG: hypothetical protein K8S18_09610 [Desulfobacula sp.]|nr:hypothetical protein [Desulfobacula sp.]